MSVLVVLLALVCLAMAAWLRAAGTAVTRIPRADALRDSAEHVSGAATVAELLEDRELINPAVSVVAVALLVVSAVLVTALLASDAGLATSVGSSLAVGLSVFFVGDLVPRQVGRHRTQTIAYHSARLLAVAIRLGGWANDLLPEPESMESGRESTTAEEEAELVGEQLGQAFARVLLPDGAPRKARMLDHDTFVRAASDALARGARDGMRAAMLMVRPAEEAFVSTLRPDDVVGLRDKRTIEILTLSMHPEAAVAIADRIQRLMPGTCAVGAALYPDHGDYFEALEAGAEGSLERAEAVGASGPAFPDDEPRLLKIVDPDLDAMLLSHAGRQALVMACQLLDRGLDAAAEEALDLVGRATRADCGLILDAAGTQQAVFGRHGAPSEDFSRSFVRRALEQGRAIYERDALTHQAASPSDSVALLAIQSVIVVPVRRGDRVAGAVYLDRRLGGKPFNDQDFRLAELFGGRISTLLEQARERGEQTRRIATLEAIVAGGLEELSRRYRYGELIGRSSEMQAIYRLIEQVKDVPFPVLIEGPTGVGKELVAKAVHYNGARRDRPFVAVNCGAIPESLAESEFFGHMPGAFTGAVSRRLGCFEMAQGGTLFLDEIEAMPELIQVKLLRALEERKIRPVGAVGEIEVDVRVIAASNHSLAALLKTGALRLDLYYRLNGITIAVPSLSSRREDVPLLVNHFLDRAAEEMSEARKPVSARAMAVLKSYAWPGNVRELKNEVQRLMALAGAKIDLRDLPPHVIANSAPMRVAAAESYDAALAEFERAFLTRALEAHDWKITPTAKKVGLSRNGLKAKLRRLGIKVTE